jgi:hypothetical protein
MTDCTETRVADALRSYQLRFQSLFHHGRAIAFPCDAAGQVDMEGLSPLARDNFLYVQTVVGLEYAMPSVQTVYH